MNASLPGEDLIEVGVRDLRAGYNALIRRPVSYERAAECMAGMTLRDKLEDFVLPYLL